MKVFLTDTGLLIRDILKDKNHPIKMTRIKDVGEALRLQAFSGKRPLGYSICSVMRKLSELGLLWFCEYIVVWVWID